MELDEIMQKCKELQKVITDATMEKRRLFAQLNELLPCQVGDRIDIGDSCRGTCEAIKLTMPSNGKPRVLLTVRRDFAGGISIRERHRAFFHEIKHVKRAKKK